MINYFDLNRAGRDYLINLLDGDSHDFQVVHAKSLNADSINHVTRDIKFDVFMDKLKKG